MKKIQLLLIAAVFSAMLTGCDMNGMGGKSTPSPTPKATATAKPESNTDKVVDDVENVGEDVGDAAKDVGDTAGDAVEGVTDAAGDAVKDADNAVKQ